MFDIQQFLNIDNYTTETRVSRRKGAGSTQEFFTPYSIVKKMCDKISDEDWSDPSKTFCEPCFGNGQFVIMIIYNRILHGIHWKTALETLYGVELMDDNVSETYQRVLDLLGDLSFYNIIDYNEQDIRTALDIMEKNLICHDFFTWNFEEWRPYTDEEIKQLKKNK